MNWQAEQSSTPLPRDVRLMNILSAMLVLALVLAGCYMSALWAMKRPSFAITRIVVEGDTSHHNPLSLQANVAGRLQGNFFTIDLAQARQVFESVPWVRKAIVRREFPNTLRVKLEEHQAVALWGADAESRLVNSYGEVFEANVGDLSSETTGNVDDLPRWVGADGQSLMLMGMQSKLDEAFKQAQVSINQIELTARNGWRVTLEGGSVLELGRGSLAEVTERTQRFLSTHKSVLAAYQRTSLERVESVDLRYSTGYAIRMRGVTTGGPETAQKKG